MSKRRKDKLLLNLKEGERYKHRVAMVNEEGGWNQHEPNAGMARMFVIMLLIHVLVIGGIIIYDFVNGEPTPAATATQTAAAMPTSALPPSAVNAAALDKAMPIEDYSTYEWRSGDSLPVVAEKLGVSEEVLIRLNMLDKGVQIDQNTILRYPRRPVVKALALGVAGANGEAAKPAEVADAPPSAPAPETILLTPPGEEIALEPTLLARLSPAPPIEPGQVVDQSPPAVKAPEKPRDVPKAVPVSREMLAAKAPNKKVVDAPQPSRSRHMVKPGETLYGIANKHGISMAALQKANNIAKPELLRSGMELVIP